MKTMKKTNQKSPFNDQAKLKILCDNLCDNIEDLLNHFSLEYKTSTKMISMACPIHGGDNLSAINLYVQGDSYRGNWKCRTHHCEQIFKGSILGFVRGILSHAKYGWLNDGDDVCSFKETIDFVSKFLNQNLDDIKISSTHRNKQQFTSIINQISDRRISEKTTYPSRDTVRNNLVIPAEYFINRGFSKEILEKYDIGLCNKPNKEMYNRVVAPIYDNNHEHMIGCSGRSIYEKCTECHLFHDPSASCPKEEYKYIYSKWKHSLNFKSQNHLYNYWFAKDHIHKDQYVIIVESPGNVWRLEEAGIHHSVAIFGSSISDRQKMILDGSGAMTMMVLTDNDEAGKKAAEQIRLKCQNTYKVIVPDTIQKNDIGDMTIEEIRQDILPLLPH